jgi:cell division septation protein DedD
MSQKTDNLIKLALVFFVSLLSFSIGTYVGKKYSDNQHKLSALEPKKGQSLGSETDLEKNQEFATVGQEQDHSTTTENMEGTSSNSDTPAALTDSEVAKIAEEFAAEEETEIPLENMKTAQEKGEVVGTIKATPMPVSKLTLAEASKQPLETKATLREKPTAPAEKPLVAIKSADIEVEPTPTDKTQEIREPASIPPKQDIVPMHYTVQIGSFPTLGEAEKLTKSLQDKGYKTSFVPAKVNGQVWYRVNVGLFGTIKEAQDYKKEFLEKTRMSSAIVQRVQY